MASKGKNKVPKIDPKHIGSTLDSFLEEQGIVLGPEPDIRDESFGYVNPATGASYRDAPNAVIGDYVGKHNETGVDLYVCAVDLDARKVCIGELGTGSRDWLNETQARAQYNYEWGQQKPIPWVVAELERQRLLSEYEQAATAPTTLCTEHEYADASPDRCVKCGKPVANRTCIMCSQRFPEDQLMTMGGGGPACLKCAERIDEGLRNDDGPRAAADDGPIPLSDDEWQPMTPERAELLGIGALQTVLTPEQLHAVLDSDDVPLAWFTVAVEAPWIERLKLLAERASMSEAKLVEDLIKRQWIASGAGKGKR